MACWRSPLRLGHVCRGCCWAVGCGARSSTKLRVGDAGAGSGGPKCAVAQTGVPPARKPASDPFSENAITAPQEPPTNDGKASCKPLRQEQPSVGDIRTQEGTKHPTSKLIGISTRHFGTQPHRSTMSMKNPYWPTRFACEQRLIFAVMDFRSATSFKKKQKGKIICSEST